MSKNFTEKTKKTAAYLALALSAYAPLAASIPSSKQLSPLEQIAQEAKPLPQQHVYMALPNEQAYHHDGAHSSTHYIFDHISSREDFTQKVPLKPIHYMWPESIMGGVLGFTYIGENFMGRRDDLVGWWARMVDIHESIHTPDEYETRVLTDHIMDRTPPKYMMIPQFILPKMEYRKK